MTLRLRFGVAGAVLLLVLVALGLTIPRVVTTSQITQVDQQLTEALPRVLVLVKGSETPSNPSVGKSAAPRADVTERFSNIYIAVITAKARDILVALGSGGASPTLPTVVSSAPGSEPKIQTVSSVKGPVAWRAVLVRHPDGQEVLVAASLESVDATDAHLRLALVVGGAALVLILAALWWWLVRLGLNPIAEVTSVADAITAGDRSRRVSEPRPGSEAAHLARAFNVMLDEEQAVEERLRRFVADASHELRTPVTVIQGVAELWREGALAGKGAIDDALRRVGQESARMATLVEDLLLLARLDEGRPLGNDPVDLSQLARDVLTDLSAIYPSHSTVDEIDDAVTTTGDGIRLRQVLSNLLSNAFVHTPSGTRVRLRVQRDGEQSVVEVEDDGSGMDPHDGPRAFERFWRGSPARSGPGSGLGLSIVAGIVAAHHGRVEMTTAPGRGTKVRVILPASPAPALAWPDPVSAEPAS
jgi:two-component system OmpR family sensor kinase